MSLGVLFFLYILAACFIFLGLLVGIITLLFDKDSLFAKICAGTSAVFFVAFMIIHFVFNPTCIEYCADQYDINKILNDVEYTTETTSHKVEEKVIEYSFGDHVEYVYVMYEPETPEHPEWLLSEE